MCMKGRKRNFKYRSRPHPGSIFLNFHSKFWDTQGTIFFDQKRKQGFTMEFSWTTTFYPGLSQASQEYSVVLNLSSIENTEYFILQLLFLFFNIFDLMWILRQAGMWMGRWISQETWVIYKEKQWCSNANNHFLPSEW